MHGVRSLAAGRWGSRRSPLVADAATGFVYRVETSVTARQQRGLRELPHSCALASRRDAQYVRIRSATAARCSSVIVRLRFATALVAFVLPRPGAGGVFPSVVSIARCIAASLSTQRPLLIP